MPIVHIVQFGFKPEVPSEQVDEVIAFLIQFSTLMYCI